jgi:three-Cys-motif partner protein
MSSGHYEWGLNIGLPPLGEHSKAKHNVYREYLKRYLRELTKSGIVSRLQLNIVDGFSGGGAYMPEQGANPYFGSPIILLETLREMQVELQSRRRQPFLLDYRVHLVDHDQGAHDVLRRTLTERGFASLVGERVFLHTTSFENILPRLLTEVRGRGATIFLLDQFGYLQVPFALLRDIFATLSKPEVILTFAYDQLVTWVQDYDRLNHRLIDIGVGNIRRDEYEAALKQNNGHEFFIQRTLHRAFLSFAKYYTPFFVMSRKSNMAFWLVHLAVHARARDVMTGLHWEMHNSFAHFGGVGHNMLGYDPNNPPPNKQAYLFDDDAHSRTLWKLQDDLPPLIRGYREGVEFRQFFADIANESPGDSQVLKQALIGLGEVGVVRILTKDGGEKRSIASLGPTDRLIMPQQPAFFFTGRPPPLFARQPKSRKITGATE